MSAQPITLNCRTHATYRMDADDPRVLASRALDSVRSSFSAPTNDGVGKALDYFSNVAARTGWGTPSLTEATDYELVRLSYDYWLMITLYRNHWIARKIVDIPARDMVRAWPRISSEMDPKDITRIDGAIRKTHTKANSPINEIGRAHV